jgi:Icc-related predicted phosphoesterase
MRIMAVSDRIVEHLYSSDVQSRYQGIDLLIGCGDLPFYYMEFLVSALDTRMVYVRGNHDIGPQYLADGRALDHVPGGLDIHRRVVELDGLIVAGLEGSMRYRPKAPYMYTEQEMRWNAMSLYPRLVLNRIRHGRAVDILVTHSPAAGIHDQRDPAHRGFVILRNLMRVFRPRYMLHGHVHVYRNDVPRVTKYLDTTVVNVYPYRVFEYGTL